MYIRTSYKIGYTRLHNLMHWKENENELVGHSTDANKTYFPVLVSGTYLGLRFTIVTLQGSDNKSGNFQLGKLSASSYVFLNFTPVPVVNCYFVHNA